MAIHHASIHGQWSGRMAFILAATGSAVGLGNIWKFPYITGENGGGAFVIVYLVCIAAIGIPIMIAEVMIGRYGRKNPINTMHDTAVSEGKSPYWSVLGWSGVIAGFFILSYYSVIAGWAISYIYPTGAGNFQFATADGVASIFNDLVGSPENLIVWHSIFMLMTMLVVARGVKGGLEKAVQFLMPALFILLLVLVGYAVTNGNFAQGVKFLFEPDFSKLTGNGVLMAMGHAFFTLSLGMGAIMVYGSYLPQDVSIAKTSIIVAFADTAVALLAGLAIFPIVFANNLEPNSGPGLIFQTLPIAFGHMPGGSFFGLLFFIMLTFAAWTSAISLIEPAVAWIVENKGISRGRACFWSGLGAWFLGLGTVFSFNIGADIKIFGKTFFESLDFLTSNIMLPLGGLAIAIFAVWVMKEQAVRNELAMNNEFGFKLWHYLVRYVTPLAVVIVFLNVVGII